MCLTWPIFLYFCPFHNAMTNIALNLTEIGKNTDGVLGIRTFGCKIVIEDESNDIPDKFVLSSLVNVSNL